MPRFPRSLCFLACATLLVTAAYALAGEAVDSAAPCATLLVTAAYAQFGTPSQPEYDAKRAERLKLEADIREDEGKLSRLGGFQRRAESAEFDARMAGWKEQTNTYLRLLAQLDDQIAQHTDPHHPHACEVARGERVSQADLQRHNEALAEARKKRAQADAMLRELNAHPPELKTAGWTQDQLDLKESIAEKKARVESLGREIDAMRQAMMNPPAPAVADETPPVSEPPKRQESGAADPPWRPAVSERPVEATGTPATRSSAATVRKGAAPSGAPTPTVASSSPSPQAADRGNEPQPAAPAPSLRGSYARPGGLVRLLLEPRGDHYAGTLTVNGTSRKIVLFQQSGQWVIGHLTEQGDKVTIPVRRNGEELQLLTGNGPVVLKPE